MKSSLIQNMTVHVPSLLEYYNEFNTRIYRLIAI